MAKYYLHPPVSRQWKTARNFIKIKFAMPFPIKVCTICGEEFELRPDKPGFANRCPTCSEAEPDDAASSSATQSKTDREGNAARRKAIRELLYRKDS